MKYFYDTEFLEDGRTIELISIGIVAEDGRELYLINRDAPWGRIQKDPWLMENVVSQLPKAYGDWRNHVPKSWPFDLNQAENRTLIACLVREFLAGPDVELWADYAAYDHVVLAQLWGKMINLPDGVPMFTNDLQQAWRAAGRPELPEQTAGAHNALEDARHLKRCFEALQMKRGR